MKRTSLLTLLLVTLVSCNSAKADDIDTKASAVESKYATSPASVALIESVRDTAKAEIERQRKLNLAAVKDVTDYFSARGWKEPEIISTWRGVFVPRPEDHGLDENTILVSTAGKSLGQTLPTTFTGKLAGALWFPMSGIVRQEVKARGVSYWQLSFTFRNPSQKVPNLPETLRGERGAGYDKFGWYLTCRVFAPDNAPTAPGGTTTVTVTSGTAAPAAPAAAPAAPDPCAPGTPAPARRRRTI